MPILRQFLEDARADRPVYICDARDAFQREGTRPFILHDVLYDGSVRRFALKLPACENPEEAAFVGEYLNAAMFNLLSALGGREIRVYIDPKDAALSAYAEKLNAIFQVDAPIAVRSGYGKCLNVNQRVLAALCRGDVRFRFFAAPLDCEPEVSGPLAPQSRPVFAALPARAGQGRFMGMDVGGTDIKLAASLEGRLCALREYDWNPSEYARAEQITGPLVMLTRLMRAATGMTEMGFADEMPPAAFARSATDAEIEAAVADMEARLGDKLRDFDGIGMCFPDVVIRNRVVGGESPKTQGMRDHPALDYEAEFRKITDLCDQLAAYVRPGGAVMNTNDGHMTAYTTAVEQAAAGRNLSEGFFAHSLGTDLGTGWILPDGSIPEIPLEAYNFVIDLGSRSQRVYDLQDVRSIRGLGTGLPGALQKYTGQFGVFRLAATRLPEADPALYRCAFNDGMFRWRGERLTVPTAPRDMRKPCLEYFMRAAEDTGSPAAELFREVGECMAVAWRETQFLLEPACTARTLFGRLVTTRACFDEICEGARRLVPDLRLEAADGTLANTPLMKQLADHSEHTVAQFAQAVGAIYYACLGIK